MRIKRLVYGVLLGGAVTVAAGVAYQSIGARRDRRRFPRIGRMVRIGGHQIYVNETGSGAPAVVLEAGIASSSLSWATVQPEIEKFARVCSYDRAGLGWSDPVAGSRSLARIVEELRALLQTIQFPYPRILVGHSFGGLVMRAYAASHPEGIAGVVLIDPVLPADWIDAPSEQMRLLALGARLSRRGAWLARIGLVRFALYLLVSGSRLIPQWIARASSGKGSSVIDRLVGEVQKLPRDLWPVVQSHWSDAKCFRAMAGYLEALPRSALTAACLTAPSHLPVTVISASSASAAQKREWDRIATRHVAAAQSGHWIQFDEPDLIVHAIQDLAERERRQDLGLL